MKTTEITGSSNIFKVAHDGTDMYVEMKGGTYKYFDVPESHYEAIIAAESAGRYLNAEIKPNFRVEKVEVAVAASEATDTVAAPATFEGSMSGGTAGRLIDCSAFDDALKVKHTGTLVRGSENAAAFDLTYAGEEGVLTVGLEPGHRYTFKTGVKVDMPPFMAAFVMARSGLAAKYGISVVNGPGLIDPDYKGEIGVVLVNHGGDVLTVKPGDRIAQLMFVPFYVPNLVQVDSIEVNTERGTGGFGSTGIAQATELMPRTKSA